jgi:hypothetical protein
MRTASFACTMERVDRFTTVEPPVRESGVTARVTLLDGPAMPKTTEATEWGQNYYECERQALSKALRAMAASLEVLP